MRACAGIHCTCSRSKLIMISQYIQLSQALTSVLIKQHQKGQNILKYLPQLSKMHNLHDSILLEIFSFLKICEKLRCSRVCLRWRRILNDWKLWQKIDLKPESRLTNFIQDDTVKDWTLAWGVHVLELYLDDCHWLTDQGICTIGDFCPNLRTLSLNGCTKIGNPGIIYLSKFCHHLRSVEFYQTRVTAIGFVFTLFLYLMII